MAHQPRAKPRVRDSMAEEKTRPIIWITVNLVFYGCLVGFALLGWLWWDLLLLGVAVAVVLGFTYRCEKCRRLWAIRRTREERHRQGDCGEVIECAYRCKHCGHTQWQVYSQWDGGS